MDKSSSFVIVGSGFSGICMGIKLIQAGYFNFTIYEKSEYLGGTWYDNTYPDCGCDVPSILYSYSFELYPEWDRMWAKQRQILQYMEHVVKKYGLEPHLQLRTTMKKSVWNEKENNWKIELTTRNSSFEVTADYLILAIGALHVPQFPNLDGLSKIDGSSSFHGDSFHAAQWNHNVSLVGKKVGIIGSGASAIQIVPEIAKTVGELYVFQRTAPYVFYKTDFEFPTFMKVLFRYVPFLMRIIRWGIFIATESRFSGLYENSLFNWWMKWDALRYMKSIVKDPELRKKITPDYTIGCKRMLFSSFWYPALCRNNVHIITNRLVGITENGITVQEEKESQDSQLNQQQKNIKEIDLDVIVYATGFQLTRDNAPEAYKFEVIGRNGISLNEWHQTGPSTLLGITAPKFPNLFHVYGPNSNLGHNSIIFMIECQTNYVIELIKKSQKKGYQNIEVKQEAVDKFQKSVIQKGMKGKVWNNCVSWYRWPIKKQNPDGSVTTVNAGEVYSMWPHSVVWYYWKTLWPSLGDYINTKI